jgi:hypothetical protein
MTEQVEKIISELKAIQTKLPELRDLFWLKIDRFNEDDRQRGETFDEKFERQTTNLYRVIDSFTTFIEKSFTPTAEEVAKEKAIEKLRAEFPSFDDWNEEAKNALITREVKAILNNIPQVIVQKPSNKPNRGPKYTINNSPDKVYNINSDFSHCRPSFLEFRNNKYAVNNWAMVLKELANILYSENPAPVNEFILKDLSKKPLFSNNQQNYFRPLEIVNGLFVESNFSANQMCGFCKKLLDIYGIAHSDVKIYLDRISAKA